MLRTNKQTDRQTDELENPTHAHWHSRRGQWENWAVKFGVRTLEGAMFGRRRTSRRSIPIGLCRTDGCCHYLEQAIKSIFRHSDVRCVPRCTQQYRRPQQPANLRLAYRLASWWLIAEIADDKLDLRCQLQRVQTKRATCRLSRDRRLASRVAFPPFHSTYCVTFVKWWAVSVWRSVCHVIWPNSRTEKSRKPKIGRMEAHHTGKPWNYLYVIGQRSRSLGRLMLSQTMHHTQIGALQYFIKKWL